MTLLKRSGSPDKMNGYDAMEKRGIFSISTKILLIILILGPLVVVGTIAVSVRTQNTFFREVTKTNVQALARSLDTSISKQDIQDQNTLQGKLYKFILNSPDVLRVSFAVFEGGAMKTIASTDVNLIDTMADAQNKQAYDTDGTVVSDRVVQGESYLFVVAPAHIAGQTVGTYELLVSTQLSDSLIRKQTYVYVSLAVVGISVFLLFVYVFLHFWLIRPLQVFIKSVDVIGKGELNHVVPIRSRDEIGQLATAFNSMTQKLRDSYEHLELKVKEKTKELAERIEAQEKQNRLLSDTKTAMLNLLEDARQLEVDLRVERDKASAIISAIGDGVVVLDNAYRVTLLNPAGETLLDVPFSKANGRYWKDIITVLQGDTPLPFDQWPVAEAVREGKVRTYGLEKDFYYLTAGGKRFPVAIATAPLKSKEGTGAVVVFRDITSSREVKERIEREVTDRTKELEEKNKALMLAQQQISEGWLQLQREKARLTASINSLSFGFILTDPEGNILMTNSAIERITGSRRDDLKHIKQLEALLAPSFDLHAHLETSLRERRATNVADVLFGAKHLRIFMAPILLFTVKEEHIGTVILAEDVTEVKAMERSKDEFFTIASHELRTPLTAIRGNTSMLKEYYGGKVNDPSFTEMIDDIHASSVRLIELVNDFLDVSRLEQKRMAFARTPFDIRVPAGEVFKELETTAKEKGIAFTLSSPDEPLLAFADQNRTKQILINLVGNAIKFTHKGEAKMVIAKKDNTIEISVSDTGIGIAPAQQGLLFHKFQQAGESTFTRDATQGTGMGLYISKLLAEGMDGSVRLVSSLPDMGSVFTLTLPTETP